jgi:hypothetical protein
VVEPDPIVVEPLEGGQHRVGDRLRLLGLAVRHRGKHAELGAAGGFSRSVTTGTAVQHDRELEGASGFGIRSWSPESAVTPLAFRGRPS